MPRYLSIEGLRARHGTDYLVRGITGDEVSDVDEDSASRAITDAEAEVDSYIGVRVALPIPGVVETADPESNTAVPEILRKLTADIALYRMAAQHDQLTEEKRKRYEDAVKWLERYAASKVSLGIEQSVPTSGGVYLSTSPRRFRRSQTGGLM